MKRFLSGFLLSGLILACAPAVFAKDGITVKVDAEEVAFDVEPRIINDRLMVPMRAIFEKLDAELEYIPEGKIVVAQKGGTVIRFSINSDRMEITEEDSGLREIALDAPAAIVDGRTLVPLRAVAESFNCDVSWDNDSKTVQIVTAETPHDGESESSQNQKDGVLPKEAEKTDDGGIKTDEKAETADAPTYDFIGMGGKTFDNINLPDVPYYCQMTHTGGTRAINVRLHYGDNKIKNLSNQRSGDYTGQTFLSGIGAVSDAKLEIKADGNWRVKLVPVTERTTLKISGTGDMVTGIFTAEADKYDVFVTHKGSGYYSIWLNDITAGRRKLFVKGKGAYADTEKLRLTVGHDYLFDVKAVTNEAWTMDFGVRGEKETKYFSSTLVMKEIMNKG